MIATPRFALRRRSSAGSVSLALVLLPVFGAGEARAATACRPEAAGCEPAVGIAPVVAIRPAGGTYTSALLAVTITWQAVEGLDASSRTITLNGADVTSSVSYSGGGSSAFSTGAITLRAGPNTLRAGICDWAGACTTATAHYTFVPPEPASVESEAVGGETIEPAAVPPPGGGDNDPPTVALNPTGGTFYNASLKITVSYGDDTGLDGSSRTMHLNGVNVTSSFDYTGGGAQSFASATLTLNVGSNTFQAGICDTDHQCTTKATTYTYTPDTTNPTVSISPTGGTYSSASRSVTVSWSDNVQLNTASDTIWLNNVVKTSSFTYSGTATSATSSGTVTLSPGTNTLKAKICDHTGTNCAAKTATYTYDNADPGVSISPSGGTYNSASRSVTVTWTDNLGLNAGSRLITLNGVNVTSSFGYSGTATSASSGGTVTLSPGTNTLSAKICDQSGRCTTQTTGYTYDGVAPAIDITPGSQTTGASSLSVLITWDDDRALNDASRVIRLNGDTVTSAFTYDFGEGDVDMQSEARITLVPGPNTLIAEICDVAGNCNAAVATYSREATAPTVAVTPASGAYRFASREATFELCDDTSLSEASFTVTLNGTQDVTVDFEYVPGGKAGCGAYATANGVVSLSAGSNTLEGRICDGYNNCRTGRADYTYDGSLPAVSVNPAGGDYKDASRPVTITWGDNYELEPDSVRILLGSTDVTAGFSYDGSTMSATSVDTLTLSPGANTLSARICDWVGNCRTQTAGYYYDAIAPAIDIASGTRSGSFLPVTIDWWDDRALDYAGSRVITFNGDPVTLQFTTLSQTATTARDSARLVLESGRNVVVASMCDGVGHCSTDSLSYEYDTVAPAVTLQPGDGGYIGAPGTITIEWCDDRDLNPSSVRVEVDDDGFVRDITSAFRYQSGGQGGCGAYATSVADTLTFWTDSVTLTAEIRDQTGNPGTASATYRVDAVAPTAVIEPQAGRYERPTVAVPVAVAWEDDVGLALGTRRITLANANGTTDLTGSFEHGGDVRRAWSEGLIALAAGTNTLAAEVCDLAGNCAPETTAVYTLDLGPEVTITATPPRIRASSPSDPPVPVIVRVDWSDAEGLDAGTKQITLDGADVTGSFHHSLGATSGRSTDTIPVAVGADTVTARICDTAEHCTTRTVTISHGVPAAPAVTTAGPNPGVTTARGLCLTAQVGLGAASECGDLRLVHALPAAATMNKARALTLLYNSAHAEPQTLLAADVRLSATAGAPDSVTATLTVDGSSAVPRATWTGTAWTTGEARRIVLQDTTPRATGIHAYRLTVTSWYDGTAYEAPADSGRFVVVNRSGSAYGAGWWPAGLERLDFPAGTGSLLWIGGDGSTREYVPVPGDSAAWAAEPVSRPDTIRRELLRDSVVYVRTLSGGTRVEFHADGRHRATVNRLGHRTRFEYVGGSDALTRVLLPVPAQDTTHHYHFTYGTGRLTRVDLHAAGLVRGVGVGVGYLDASKRIASLTDPDAVSVAFAYDDAAHPNRITARTDRRGTVTAFAYDAAGKVAQGTVDPAGLALATTLAPQQSQGLSPTAADPAQAYTRIDGPRADVLDHTRFWLDRFGAPEQVQDAYGHTTTLLREDPTYPALVTEVRHPNGFVEQAVYDARGNRVEQTALDPYGDGRNATTRYQYADTLWPDFVTRITGPEGVASAAVPDDDIFVFGYDPLTGNRLWQQDARGDSSRVAFRYDALGLLRAVDAPLTPPDSVEYDARGNLRRTRTPSGFVTEYLKDALGRDTLVLSPIDSAQAYKQRHRIAYDLLGRDTLEVTTGPAMGSLPAQDVVVRKAYDPGGNPIRVARHSQPDTAQIGTITTEWRYDTAGRTVAEIAPDGARDSLVYDPAGNVVRKITRRGHTIRFVYDALGRLVRRVTPAVRYAQELIGVEDTLTLQFPIYPNDGVALLIPADTARFTYDAVGNMTTADNRYARIRRHYHLNGLVRADTLHTATYAGDFDPTLHVYGIRYGYDRNARRTRMIGPEFLASPRPLTGPRDSTLYRYSAWGALEAVNAVEFAYDFQGRLIHTTYPSGMNFEYTYTPEDARATRVGRGVAADWVGADGSTPTDTIHADRFVYDARGKTRFVRTQRDSTFYTYTGLGMLARSAMASSVDELQRDERWTYDALGNATFKKVETSSRTKTYDGFHYESGTGRLLASRTAGSTAATDSSAYDAAGNRIVSYRVDEYGQLLRPVQQYSRSYYGADDRLYALDRQTNADLSVDPWDLASVFDEYRYDALGRRVLVRARRDIHCPGCESTIARSVWDGDQVLFEIRMPGFDSLSAAALERDTATIWTLECPADPEPNTCGDYEPEPMDTVYSPYYGRVRYIHGPQIDRPLYLVRIGYGRDRVKFDPFELVPHTDWRGSYDLGTVNGRRDDQHCEVHTRQSDGSEQLRCLEILWPAPDEGAYKERFRYPPAPVSWMGSLIEGMADGSGLMYRRNRYYDPVQGRFTQEDPIGIAGGLNLYGYANGDPVNFSDPFGLTPDEEDCHTRADEARCKLREPEREEQARIDELIQSLPETGVCGRIRAALNTLNSRGQIRIYDEYFSLGPGEFMGGDAYFGTPEEPGEIHVYSGRATNWSLDPNMVIHEAGHSIGLRHAPGSVEIAELAPCYR